jgi:hypothetical protein
MGNENRLFTGQSSSRGRPATGIVFYSSCAADHVCLSASHMRAVMGDEYAAMLLDVTLAFCEVGV